MKNYGTNSPTEAIVDMLEPDEVVSCGGNEFTLFKTPDWTWDIYYDNKKVTVFPLLDKSRCREKLTEHYGDEVKHVKNL